MNLKRRILIKSQDSNAWRAYNKCSAFLLNRYCGLRGLKVERGCELQVSCKVIPMQCNLFFWLLCLRISQLCSLSDRYFFFLLDVYRHLLFDKFPQSVANMKKFWAKHRFFLPASVHQMIPSKKNNKYFQLMVFWQLFARICHLVMKCCKLFPISALPLC